MIFRHQLMNRQLEWNETTHCCELVIESPHFLRRLIKDFNYPSEATHISITEQGKPLKFEKDIDVIFNPLRLDFNDRRVTATLLKMLVKTSLSEDYYLSTNTFKARIIRYLDQIVDAENFNFEVSASDDFNIDAIAKATNLHIVRDEDDFVTLLIDYMSMMAELAHIKFFVFFNLRSLLSRDEILRFCHDLDNHQLDVLLLESQDYGKFPGIERILIDHDDCEI